ncbi:MAG: hypothetical protein AB8B62_19810 [Roseobacter sp.]
MTRVKRALDNLVIKWSATDALVEQKRSSPVRNRALCFGAIAADDILAEPAG